ncbi:OmpA family protein [Flavobacterium sp. NRK F10]|uniref:OmpA family protein n=1 Tax=Flavobacterium sp. NRK F10 TaxID=2954931 RepID=UPI0020901DB4|nr:OmpA family protein [Flavobacterium sp. NRK F10]MCO6175609.1 OmpA family protein [Flavobacterium sp. NRK F10]
MNRIFYLLFLFFSFTAFSQDTISFYFETDKYELSATEKIRLREWIIKNRKSKILSIRGYTDEVGTNQYNDTLSQKRVKSIYRSIVGKIKIREDFKTISYGENFKQSEIKAENRRASIYYLKEEDLDKEQEVLGLSLVTIEKEEEIVEIPDDAPLHVKVAAAKVGDKIILKNINFYQNTFQTTQESQAALYDLLFVLQNNPNLTIQIQGHICCVDSDRRNLSLERAKQVRRFLMYKGIPMHRVSVTGYGVRYPIYPIPEDNEEQAAANRRVEIEILSK